MAPTNYGHGSLRETLFHMLRAEWTWRVLCQDQYIQPALLPRSEDFASLDKIKARWQEEEQLMRRFLTGLSDEEIAGKVQIKNRDGTETAIAVWHMLVHAAMHSMQHRSEAAAILTSYGQSPGDLDFIFYV